MQSGALLARAAASSIQASSASVGACQTSAAGMFAEVPDLYTLLGALLIVVSTLYIGHREAQLGKRATAPRVNAEV